MERKSSNSSTIDVNGSKERELLKFLKLITEILDNSENNPGILNSKLDGKIIIDLTMDEEEEELSVIKNEVLRKTAFSEKDFKQTIHNTITVLLEYILYCINHNSGIPEFDRMLMHFTITITEFLEKYQNHVSIKEISTTISTFLLALINIFQSINKNNFVEIAPNFQLLLNMIAAFRKIKAAEKILLEALLKNLKKFSGNLMKAAAQEEEFDIFCYENLLLYLSVLEGILQHNMERTLLIPDEQDSNVWKDMYADIKNTLKEMLPLTSSYVTFMISNCLNTIK